jgi:hypothetical protein
LDSARGIVVFLANSKQASIFLGGPNQRTHLADREEMEEVGMRLLLVGDNARYLAHRWVEHGMVDNSDDEESVELYPKPADALYDCYLKRLRAEAREVSVGLMLDGSTPLP